MGMRRLLWGENHGEIIEGHSTFTAPAGTSGATATAEAGRVEEIPPEAGGAAV
jgi:hypothetical protein